jgi:YVTN family beta-propeller protein
MARQNLALIRILSSAALVTFAACGGGGSKTTPDSGTDAYGGQDTNPGVDAGKDASTGDSTAPQDATPDSPAADGGVDTSMPSDGGGDGSVDTSTPTVCATTATGPTRGSAIAISPDGTRLLAVNRDVGSVTILSVDYSDGFPSMTVVKELAVGGEPWQVAIDACGTTGYVVLRKDQQVVEITGVGATPAIGRMVHVGSEPTSLALTPNNKKLYVSNWVDGTLSVIDGATMTRSSTVDLNQTLAATGLLGTSATARASLAHPRGVAITNNGDANDDDETVYVTEWFAQRTMPENAANLAAGDTNFEGLLYQVTSAGAATAIPLPPVADTGFADAKGNKTGCYPNQVASVTIDGAFAYVTSTCASPVGPTGVFQKGACQIDANCTGGAAGSCVNGSCKGSCTVDADCGMPMVAGLCDVTNGGACKPFTANAKTTTHPAVTIVPLTGGGAATTTTLDTLFSNSANTQNATASARMPLLPTDMGFKPGFGYVASEGADALFRLVITNGAITKVGSATGDFIDVKTPVASGQGIHLPIGVVTHPTKSLAFVADDGTRDVTAIDLNTQAVASSSGGTDFRVTATTALPQAGTAAASQLNGKRLFNTGLGRWSLQGAAWGSCAACHIDGLSDNVTWYFARGPRQSVSLDGTFASSDPTNQRILNWSAIADEIPDFEANVRGISGGVGALVSMANAVCTIATQTTDCPNSQVCNPITLKCNPDARDRINQLTQTPQQIGLQGSTEEIGNPAGTSTHPHTVINDWIDITNWIKTIRSPRAATNLVAADVAAGMAIFSDSAQGNCVGCHGGPKWTISTRFYTPSDVLNDAAGSTVATSLSGTSWNTSLAGFPTALFPSTTAGKQTMRSGAVPAFEQIQCVLRPVGTIKANAAVPTGVSDPAVNVLELRQDMVTGAQGAGGTNANDFTFGFNPPSLLGMQVGAPYFHAGNARTLEEAFGPTFLGHHQSAVAQVFNPTAPQIQQLVAFLLSIDESTPTVAIPAAGNRGGDICFHN